MKAKRYAGFTLIELMIVVVVLALLAVVAFPSYRDHVAKAKRAEGRTALLKAAQIQERFFSDQNKYATTAELKTAMAVTAANIYSGENPNDDKSSYTLTVALTGAPPTAFTLSATPQGSFSDPTCGALTLTERGVRSWGTAPATPEKCKW